MNMFRPPADAWSRRDFMRNGSYSLALVCTFGTTSSLKGSEITKYRLKAVRRGATVRFTLSENAAVTIRFKKGSRTLRTARRSMRAGSRAITVRGAKLVKGRYSVQTEARDARGNRAPVARKTVRVKR